MIKRCNSKAGPGPFSNSYWNPFIAIVDISLGITAEQVLDPEVREEPLKSKRKNLIMGTEMMMDSIYECFKDKKNTKGKLY